MTNQPKRKPINAAPAPVENNAEVHEQKEEQPIAATTPTKEEITNVELAAPDPVLPDSDEEWEKKIEQAKEDAKKQATQNTITNTQTSEIHVIRDAMANPGKIESEQKNLADDQANEPEKSFDIEAEVERRVAERLAKKNIPMAAKPEEPKKPEVSDEEIKQKQATIAKKNDASRLIFLNLGDDTDFDIAVTKEFEEDERPESAKTNEPTDYAAGMSLIREYGQRTQQQKLLKEWINDLVAKNPDALKAVDDKLRVCKITPKIGDGTGPKKLSGSAAKAAVISRMKGMFRIQLYNSGFWIDICPPSLVEIDNWMQAVDQDFKELGRCLGGHAHTCIDVFLKQKFCEILPDLIQRSNYENWEDKNALIKNISFHDYDTLLWGICCSMYREGIGIGVYCTNPDCRNIDNQFVDIAKLCYINTEKFPKQAMEWMVTHAHNTSQHLTDADLANYRDKLLGFSSKISVDNGINEYELGVPLLMDYVNMGAALIGKITAYTNGEKSIHSDSVTNQLTFHLYKMLLPWIKTLSMNDSDGNLIYKIEDRDAIYESLDINTFDNSDFYNSVVKFIEDTKLSFYAAHTLECPKCGKKAELDKDNMLPFDLQYVFFGLCCLQMNQNGASF